jgi:tRNA nucleotidyltransferase (CCA-adding enzyme)
MASTRNRAVKKSISRYYNQLKDIQPSIGGQDLLAIGLKPGPIFRQILEAVLDAKLNGKVETHQQEIDFAQRWVQSKGSHNFLDSRSTSR